MDVITIRDLRVETHVGVTKSERARTQTVVISIDIESDLTAPAASDDVADTVDYDKVATQVADLVRSSESSLLEHLAGKIADLVSGYKGVDGVTVEIMKERPPIDEDVGAVVVSLERPLE
ncbi:MAG TPA: dihydroneopterin aldolase [Actinomycetota bacterium]|nr:dihydroneopterin aldolase [Actinomycetota bacterium]